jgi:hypothetical protein
MMSKLSPNLRELVQASRKANLPTQADAERVFAVLRARLGDAAVAGTRSAMVTSHPTGLLLSNGSALGFAGLALLGGLLFFTARADRVVPRDANALASAAATTATSVTPAAHANPSDAPAPAPDVKQVAAGAKPAAEREAAPPVASYRAKDKLAEEVALLSRAETALHGGKPTAALEALNEHERKFPNGLLTEERIAARIQALCALGRTAEADAQLTRLSPKSLHGEPSRQACR